MTCLSVPVSMSLLLLSSHGAIPLSIGSLMTFSSLATSVSLRVPVFLVESICARLQTAFANVTPMPLILDNAKSSVFLPSRSVCATRTRCLNVGCVCCSAILLILES